MPTLGRTVAESLLLAVLALLLFVMLILGFAVEWTFEGLGCERALYVGDAGPADVEWLAGMQTVLPDYGYLRWEAFQDGRQFLGSVSQRRIIPAPHFQGHIVGPGEGCVIRIAQSWGSMFQVSDSLQYVMISAYIDSEVSLGNHRLVIPDDVTLFMSKGYYGGEQSLGFGERGWIEIQQEDASQRRIHINAEISLYTSSRTDIQHPGPNVIRISRWFLVEEVSRSELESLTWLPSAPWPSWSQYLALLYGPGATSKGNSAD